ncbi:molecular chaperone [Leptolyngbyaceae cyanobacterium CCMR0082]|uniref:Molecular chaperone n=2 Tax=Adonisia turfae TaxID=2950184 RepID=A0A6M0SFV0_9CYAN|nr:fimbria/pilus periplasmic chaperone [Leptothoe sp. LEGE 181152]NEZ57850.1 molecular chaperone [Adonisia turfae CCMR0081]NEZ66472.1 molecular chaperone [Adonisia turfae CCMR0082]
MFRHFSSALTLTTCLLLGTARPSLAFQFNPLSQVFTPTGSEATQSYEIVNDTDEPIAVEVSVVLSEMDLTGDENFTPAEDDFLVYPPQMILAPDEIQMVRVTWLGDPTPTQELTYRLIAEQLPIHLVNPEAPIPNEPRGEIKLSFRYISSVFIRPQNVAPDVSLVSVEPTVIDSGETKLSVVLENQGNGNARLSDWQLEVVGQGQTVQLTPALAKEMNSRVILPGQQRQFDLPWPEGLPIGDVMATFQFEN